MKYLLDASALIEWLNGRENTVRLLDELASAKGRLAVNAVSLAEVYSGVRPERRAPVDRALERLEYWHLDRETAIKAGHYRYAWARRGRSLTLADTLMAAHAVLTDARLITGNVKDFPMPEIKILPLPGD